MIRYREQKNESIYVTERGSRLIWIQDAGRAGVTSTEGCQVSSNRRREQLIPYLVPSLLRSFRDDHENLTLPLAAEPMACFRLHTLTVGGTRRGEYNKMI
jgi:hypothetical protein